MLRSMLRLKYLYLDLPMNRDGSALYRVEKVFSNGSWTALEEFSFGDFTCTCPDFLRLIIEQMPNMRRLSIVGDVVLEGTTWREFFENMVSILLSQAF